MNTLADRSKGDRINRWPHRWAVLLACATFPLIWVGGLVTTYDAGMAVPDWPSTYGRNLFLYPLSTWWAGPWDLFIEHGHRLLGALVGLLAISLLVSVWRSANHRHLRGIAFGALVLVIGQGLLGGMRVELVSRSLAMVHGCVAQAFFALSAVLVVLTAQHRRSTNRQSDSKETSTKQASSDASVAGDLLGDAVPFKAVTTSAATSIQMLTCITSGMLVLQLLLGAQLRHVATGTSPAAYRACLSFHLLVAALLVLHIFSLAWKVRRNQELPPQVKRPVSFLPPLVLLQVVLGLATWVSKFGCPQWLLHFRSAAAFTVEAEGFMQTLIVTGHVATAALLLAMVAVSLTQSFRLLKRPATVAALGGTAFAGALA